MTDHDHEIELEHKRDSAAENISLYHEGEWEARPHQLRTEAQAIVDWCNYEMGEGDKKPKPVVVDPFGAPVDTRGM